MLKTAIKNIQFNRYLKLRFNSIRLLQQKSRSNIEKVIPILSAIRIYHNTLTDMSPFLNKTTKEELVWLLPSVLIFHLSLHSIIRTPFIEQMF